MIFNPVYINATTLDDCWFKLLHSLNEKGRKYLITEGSYKGAYRLAFDDISGFINYPHQRPLAPIVPEGALIPTNDEDIEKYFVEYLMDGKVADNEDYKYGTFIVGGKYNIPKNIKYFNDVNDPGVNPAAIIIPNQLDWIINHFKEKEFGNAHCFLTVGYPESNFAYDLKYTNEQERKTSPCLRGLDFRIIEENTESVKQLKCTNCKRKIKFGKGVPTTEIFDFYYTCQYCNSKMKIEFYKENYLLTKVIYRSWDLYSGFPVNMGGFTLLNEFVASELGINPGPLSFTCKDLHCYDFEIEPMLIRLNKKENINEKITQEEIKSLLKEENKSGEQIE